MPLLNLHRSPWSCLLLLSGAIGLLFTSPKHSFAAVPTFQIFGPLSETEDDCYVRDMSIDGRVVVGACRFRGNLHAFRWDAEEGMVRLPDLAGSGDSNEAWAVSADGAVIVGQGVNSSGVQEAFRWTSAAGTVGLGDLPGGSFSSIARGISDDGRVIVGRSAASTSPDYDQAFRWTAEEGMVSLGYMTPGDDWSYAWATSADGSIVVGRSDRRQGNPERFDAFRWTAADGMVGLGELPATYEFGNAFEVTPDGSVIVGSVSNAGNNGQPFIAMRWTESTGMVPLGELPGGATNSFAYGVSDDGSIVVGYEWQYESGDVITPTRALIWDQAHGLRDLRDVLQNEYGLDLTEWTLAAANSISGDGTVIAGWAYKEGNGNQRVPWRAVLGTPGDTNLDGLIDLNDLNNVRNHFGEGTLGGSRVPGDAFPFDGVADLDDLNLVRNHFGVGAAAVPEPSAFVLAIAACVASVVRCVRRKQISLRAPSR